MKRAVTVADGHEPDQFYQDRLNLNPHGEHPFPGLCEQAEKAAQLAAIAVESLCTGDVLGFVTSWSAGERVIDNAVDTLDELLRGRDTERATFKSRSEVGFDGGWHAGDDVLEEWRAQRSCHSCGELRWTVPGTDECAECDEPDGIDLLLQMAGERASLAGEIDNADREMG